MKFFALFLPFFLSFFSSILYADSPKYIFFFVGDGMGKDHVNLWRQFTAKEDITHGFDRFIVQGSVDTSSFGERITNSLTGKEEEQKPTGVTTDSAAAATALFCGMKTNNKKIGISSDGQLLKSLGFMAKETGYKVAVISSDNINGATPAGVYAHVNQRDKYEQIGLEMHLSDFDYFGGAELMGEKTEQLIAEKALKTHGYTVLHGRKEMESYKGVGKIFAATSDTMAENRVDSDNSITIDQQLKNALRAFEGASGFFIMVEGAHIDHAAEANDVYSMLAEISEFHQAILRAFAFADKHPNETLIVVTADHNSGGLKIIAPDGKLSDLQIDLIRRQKKSLSAIRKELEENVSQKEKKDGRETKVPLAFDELVRIVSDGLNYPFTDADLTELRKQNGPKFNHLAFYKTAIRLRDRAAGLTWSTGGHTNEKVLIFAFGADADLFAGELLNSDICRKIANAAFPDASPFKQADVPAK